MSGQLIVKASEYLLDKTPKYQPESPILLSPLFDEHGACHGVLGQLLHMPDIDKPLDDLLQDYEQDPNLSRSDEKADSEDKASIRVDEPREVHGHQRSVNLKENRLFRRFAQILPTGLAVLDERAEVSHNTKTLHLVLKLSLQWSLRRILVMLSVKLDAA